MKRRRKPGRPSLGRNARRRKVHVYITAAEHAAIKRRLGAAGSKRGKRRSVGGWFYELGRAELGGGAS